MDVANDSLKDIFLASFLRSFAAVGSNTMISRVLGFTRDLVLARMFGADAATDARITSYNVCYTKLLRTDVDNAVIAVNAAITAYEGKIVEAIAPEALVGHWTFDDRITSYNVCYTKLLRSMTDGEILMLAAWWEILYRKAAMVFL